MESLVKEAVGFKSLRSFGGGGGGCISSGQGYDTDQGRIYVKMNNKDGAKTMFDGEYASLETIYSTGTICVPKPIKVAGNPGKGALLVTEYIDMDSLHGQAAELGRQLAELHLHNSKLLDQAANKSSSVHKDESMSLVENFGFHATTCCGYLPQDNTWEQTWPEFYARRKLGQQISMAEQKYGDRQASELWGRLQRKLPDYFKDLHIVPALLHGDLWGGNVAQNDKGPVIFDPASFYGHHEFDLGIANMFGGFPNAFWQSYHSVIPKQAGWQKRNELYQLFHYLNHWNHFGGGYRGTAISIMKTLS